MCPLTNRWISIAACLWHWNVFQHIMQRKALCIFITASLWNKNSLFWSLFREMCPLTNRWISIAACLWHWNVFQHIMPRIALWIFVTASIWNKNSILWSLFREICPLANRWISIAACLWHWNVFQHIMQRIAFCIFVAASLWNKKSLLINQQRQCLWNNINEVLNLHNVTTKNRIIITKHWSRG